MNRRRRQSCARSTGGRTPASCPQFTRHPPGASSPRLARLLSIAPRLRLCAAGARGGGGLEAVENRGSGGYRPSPQRGCACPQVLSPAESGGDGSDMLCLLARLNANVRGREGPAEKPQRPTPNRVRISRRPRLVTSSARLSRSWTTHFRVSAIFRSAAPKAPPTCGVRSVAIQAGEREPAAQRPRGVDINAQSPKRLHAVSGQVIRAVAGRRPDGEPSARLKAIAVERHGQCPSHVIVTSTCNAKPARRVWRERAANAAGDDAQPFERTGHMRALQTVVAMLTLDDDLDQMRGGRVKG